MKATFNTNTLELNEYAPTLVNDLLENGGFELITRKDKTVFLNYPLYTSAIEAKEIYRKAQKDLALIK